MFGGPFGYRRRFYGPRYRRQGCGCGALGTSLLLSALLTFIVNQFTRRL